MNVSENGLKHTLEIRCEGCGLEVSIHVLLPDCRIDRLPLCVKCTRAAPLKVGQVISAGVPVYRAGKTNKWKILSIAEGWPDGFLPDNGLRIMPRKGGEFLIDDHGDAKLTVTEVPIKPAQPADPEQEEGAGAEQPTEVE